MKIDIFCRIIDFWGDAAVSWRLACALKKAQPQWDITFYCDDWLPWRTLTGISDKVEKYQNITLKDYSQKSYARADAALAVLSCDLPEKYPSPKLTVNVEYLTSENWAADCHLKQSYPKPCFFFLPGIFQGTGGLVFGDFFEKQVFVQDIKARRLAWAEKMRLNLDPEKNWVSCYVYDLDFESLRDVRESIFIGPALPHLSDKKFGNFVPMILSEYDELLWLCDQHLVRGEDSLSRAVLTGKPFLWQAYPQKDKAHEKKIEALIMQISRGEATEKEMLQKHFEALNTRQMLQWPLWQKEQNHLARDYKELQKRVIALGSQEMLLSQFILQNV